MQTMPRSIEQLLACPCEACTALSRIYQRCVELKEPLYILDARMFGKGYAVADTRVMFTEPAAVADSFEEVAEAAEFVFARQQHCYAWLSSWPEISAGRKDFTWRMEQIVEPSKGGS